MRVDLRSRLKANATITAIVGTAIDWNRRTGLPSIRLINVTPGRTYTFDGATGLHGALVQFDCMALTDAVADQLYRAVRAEMEQAATVGSTKFGMSFLEGERDMQVTDIDGIGAVGGISADFRVWFQGI